MVEWQLYELMLRSRLFEEAVAKLWEEGKIFGEMHLGIGEEAIIAGIISQLLPGDAIATDHRSTPPFIMRGVSPVALLLEFLGHSEGLCSGMGGHMHLFSKEHLIASSGIVGSSGPSATGFALASKYKQMDNIAVAFFGEGAMNQGMMLESLNLASTMKLPVLFVCKDNEWAVTTRSSEVTGGNLLERAKGFGIEGVEVDGLDAKVVWETTNEMISNMRGKKSKPFFIHAHCVHQAGHFLGDPLIRPERAPMSPLLKSVLSRKGARIDKKIGGLSHILSMITSVKGQLKDRHDPLKILRKKLASQKEQLSRIESSIQEEIDNTMKTTKEIYQQEGAQ
ncbi:MAG: thiamine pyrophosphate-dependent dehydrogenase E1 component subunit alpha [Candidatus Hodarchaeales archaeon]|jgi:pyruvate dehydrogenase E1 component alpha subunit